MKTTLKKTLAILLATLFLLGVTAVGASAESWNRTPNLAVACDDNPLEGTLEIIDPGKAQIKIYPYGNGYYGIDSLDLSGLVFKASGGGLSQPQTANYDDVSTEDYRNSPKLGKIIWSIWINEGWDMPSDGWVPGENEAVLCVRGYQYTEFVPVKTIDGVEYGYFAQETVFYGEALLTVTAVDERLSQLDKNAAIALTLGVPAKVNIKGNAEEDGSNDVTWFKFTPSESGFYSFQSKGGQWTNTLWTKDGERRDYTYLRIGAALYDEDGIYLASANYGYNFLLEQQLEAGKTYYLWSNAYYEGKSDTSYSVTAEVAVPRSLTAKVNEITIKNGEYIAMTDLVELNGWELWDLSVDCEGAALMHEREVEYSDGYYYYTIGFTGYRRGSETLYITAPDGEEVQIKVKVTFSFSGLWRAIKNGLYEIGDFFQNLFGNTFNNGPLKGALALLTIPFIVLALPFLLLYFWLTGQV